MRIKIRFDPAAPVDTKWERNEISKRFDIRTICAPRWILTVEGTNLVGKPIGGSFATWDLAMQEAERISDKIRVVLGHAVSNVLQPPPKRMHLGAVVQEIVNGIRVR